MTTAPWKRTGSQHSSVRKSRCRWVWGVWPSFRVSLAAGLIVVGSFFLVALASSLALVRAEVEHLDANLASVIGADYSADPRGVRLAPLSEGIVDVARQDENTLQEAVPGIEIVPVYHPPTPAAAEPA